MENNFIWRKVSEKEIEEIRKNAKNLLNEFAKKISKIKAPQRHFENDSGIRQEGKPWQTDKDFREMTFQNAPFVEDNSIVAEKGAWKK